MSFRFKKSGQRTYIQIVENKRVDGAVRQSVIANLGRADELAASGAFRRRLGRPSGIGSTAAEIAPPIARYTSSPSDAYAPTREPRITLPVE